MNDEIDRAIHETRELLAARPAPDFRAAVMSRIARVEPLPLPQRPGVLTRLARMVTRLARMVWAPRPISIRPAFALAAAAAVVLLLVMPYARMAPPTASQMDRASANPQVFVQFRLDASASRVQLAGSFTNWEPRYDMRQSAPGVWTITVPLTQGVHDYAFVVDGQQWIPDPYAPQIGDGFGGTNSRLALMSPVTPQL
jgi:hypothetical protein